VDELRQSGHTQTGDQQYRISQCQAHRMCKEVLEYSSQFGVI
jgi:hypothetical protein